VKSPEAFPRLRIEAMTMAENTSPSQEQVNRLIALYNQGRLQDALVQGEALAMQFPNHPYVPNLLGAVNAALGRPERSIASYTRALQINPAFSEAHNNLGVTLNAIGRHEEAVASFKKALQIRPEYAEAHYNLGIALDSLGRREEAVLCYKNVLRIDPDFAEAYSDLGNALFALGDPKGAIESYDKALEIKPDYAEAHNNLGNVQCSLGDRDRALASYNEALRIRPDYAEAHNNLGKLLSEIGKPDEAASSYRRALEIRPGIAEVHNNLGNTLCDLGELEEAIANFNAALQITPRYADAHSNLLMCLQYDVDVDAPRLKQEHMRWNQEHGAYPPTSRKLDSLDTTSNRPLKIGLVSPDFALHIIGFLTIKLIENADPREVLFYCYSDRPAEDDYTRRFESAAHQWSKVYGLSDEELAQKIREDRIDILFDLTGHTANNRLTMFAIKPSPVQISWAGYVGTTGLESMDYVLADRFHIPEGEDENFVEEVLRLPESYVCYDPPSHSLPVSGLPAKKNGYVTFGCFSNPTKINARLIDNWSRILQATENSKIILKYKGLDSQHNRERILSVFRKNGIDERRVAIEGRSPHAGMLERYSAVDIALDTVPYSGCVTTCEALWMGVPVVTIPGRTFAGRHSFSHLSNIGCTYSIARDYDEYVGIAVSLAGDLNQLSSIRSGLRQQLENSSLCDGPRFTEAFCSLMHQVWTSFVAKS